jgi:streptogramin lyase
VDTSQVEEIFGLLPPISFPQHTIEQFMQRVVKITNATYRVDYYKRMEYLTLGTIPAPFAFSIQPNFGLFLLPGELPTFPGEQWEGGHDETELINRVWVVGASFVGTAQTYVVSPPPNGVQWIFQLPAKMKSITTATVTVNGVDLGMPGTLGTDGTLEPGTQSTWTAPVLIGTGGIGQPPTLAFQTPPAAPVAPGAIIETWPLTPTAPNSLFSICTGPDGNIWVANYANGQGIGGVFQIAPATGATQAFPLAGSNPVAICAGPDGNVWVADRSQLGLVWQIEPNNGDGTPFQCSRGGGLDMLHGICTGPDGNLWVTSGGNDEGNGQGGVWKVTPTGLATFYALAGSANEGICVGPDGNLWVCDVLQEAIWKVNPLNGVGVKYPIAGAQLNNWVCAGPDGNIWACDEGNGSLWQIAPATGVATQVALPGADSVRGVISGTDGNVWAVEYTHGQIWQIQPGTPATPILMNTDAAAEWNGLCAGPDGNLWGLAYGPGTANSIAYGSSGTIIVVGDFEYPLIQVISNPEQVASTGGVYFDYLLRDTRITSIAEAQQVGLAKLSTQGVPKGAGGLTSRYRSWANQLLQVGQTVSLYNPVLYANNPDAQGGYMYLLITNMTMTLTDDTVQPWLVTVDFSDQPDVADDDVFTQALNEAGRINAALGAGDVDDIVEDQQSLGDYLALLDAMSVVASAPQTNVYDGSLTYDSGRIYEY